MTPERAHELSEELASEHPARVLEAALSSLDRVAITTSFGATAAVMLHLASRASRRPDVLFVDTGYHFASTLTFGQELAERLGLEARVVRPQESVAEHEARRGALYRSDPDACCAMRKVDPLDAALADYDGWITGVRRQQALTRRDMPLFSVEPLADRTIVKVAPMAAWTERDVRDYLTRWDLPVSPLVELGYRSIGCEPCTSRTRPEEDPRSGRWSDFSGKTECGLHLRRPEVAHV